MNLIKILHDLKIETRHNAVGWHVDSGEAATYESATSEMIRWAENEIGQLLPEDYKVILLSSNGLFLNDLSLFGIPLTWFQKGVINRSMLEPFNIVEGNKSWRISYNIESTALMIGSIEGETENIGIFMWPTGVLHLARESGELLVADMPGLIESAARLANR